MEPVGPYRPASVKRSWIDLRAFASTFRARGSGRVAAVCRLGGFRHSTVLGYYYEYRRKCLILRAFSEHAKWLLLPIPNNLASRPRMRDDLASTQRLRLHAAPA